MSRSALLHASGFALAIAAFASIWLVVMTVTGWYRDPDKMELAIAVPIVEIILLVLASVRLRRDGCTVPARVGLCLAITVAAAILFAGFAYVYTSAQDNYFTHVQQAHAEGLQRAGKSDAEIVAALANHPISTPKGFAVNRFRNMLVFGVIGTLLGLAVPRRRA